MAAIYHMVHSFALGGQVETLCGAKVNLYADKGTLNAKKATCADCLKSLKHCAVSTPAKPKRAGKGK